MVFAKIGQMVGKAVTKVDNLVPGTHYPKNMLPRTFSNTKAPYLGVSLASLAVVGMLVFAVWYFVL